jgi:hypothetical protein
MALIEHDCAKVHDTVPMLLELYAPVLVCMCLRTCMIVPIKCLIQSIHFFVCALYACISVGKGSPQRVLAGPSQGLVSAEL